MHMHQGKSLRFIFLLPKSMSVGFRLCYGLPPRYRMPRMSCKRVMYVQYTSCVQGMC